MEDNTEPKITKRQWIKYWIKGTYDNFLQFIGIRLPDEWLLLQAIEKEYGDDAAKSMLTSAIILGLDFGKRNNKETIRKIRENVKKGPRKIKTKG